MKKNKLMMWAVVAVLLMVLFPYVSSAQTIKFNMGPEYKLKKISSIPDRFVHGDKESSYLLWNNINIGSVWASAYSFGLAKIKSTASLEKYDGKFNQVFKNEFTTNLKDLNFEDLVWDRDKFLLFTSKFDKTTKTNTAYGNFMDVKGNADPKSVPLMKIEVDSKRRTGGFDFCISDDSTKILVYATPPYDKNEERKFAFSVYSNDMVKQWEKVVVLPYKEKMVKIEDYTVSNKGDVYILIKKYDQEVGTGLFNKEAKKTDKGKEANYKYVVLAYTNQGNDHKEYVLDLKGKFVLYPTFKLDPKGNLAVAGFYSDLVWGNEKGIFYMTINAETKEITAASTKEFTKEMIDAMGKNMLERKNKGKDQGLKYFVFRDFHLRDDGGAVMLAENYYVIEITYTDKYGMHTRYEYHYNDIIAVSVNPKGEIEWFSRLPKAQVASAPLKYLSFSSMVVGDKIYVVYNDNKKNTGDSNKTRFYSYKDGVAVIATIDATGKMTKKNLFDLKENKTILMAQLGQQINSNTMAVYMQKGKKFRLGSITVDDKGASAGGEH